MPSARSCVSLGVRRPFALGLLLISLLLGVAPAQAQEPPPASTPTSGPVPPIGKPIDRFAGRHAIGVEGVVTLGNGYSSTALNLRRLHLRQTASAGDAPPATFNPPQLVGASESTGANNSFPQSLTAGAAGFAEGDLDLVTADDGTLRPSLEPGLLVAARGITSPDGCSGGGFCLTWFPPTYDDDHNLRAFEPAKKLAVRLASVNGPRSGSDIAIATGTFNSVQEPSVVVAWVEEEAAGDPHSSQIRMAHVTAQRNDAGDVTGLTLQNAWTVGATYWDPNIGSTSPALAVGDFAGAGQDQVALVWGARRPAGSDQPRISFQLLEGAPDGALQTAIDTETLGVARPRSISWAYGGQVGPGAVAQRDIRGNGEAIDRLIVAPGVSGTDYLYRFDIERTSAGMRFYPHMLAGPKIPPLAAGDPDRDYATAHSKLESLGDLDGDGLDEVLATPHAAFNPHGATSPAGNKNDPCFYRDPVNDPANPEPNRPGFCGRIEVLDFGSKYPALGTGFTVETTTETRGLIETAVIDARPTGHQRIAPASGAVDLASLPQVAVSFFSYLCPFSADFGDFNTCRQRPALTIVSMNKGEGKTVLLPPKMEDTWIRLASDESYPVRNRDDRRRPAPITGLALDGRVELGDPVQGSYSSIEPSVILNSPPTHFDVLGGRAYDLSACYAGNQSDCAFDSEYERISSTSTEVTTSAAEDWGVSATVNVDADFGVAQAGLELRSSYGENFTEVNGALEKQTVQVNVRARNTDKIYAFIRRYDTLEYPLYQPGSAEPDEYVLATTPHTVSQRWIDSSSPTALSLRVNHQPGHILSYPEDLTREENPFISPTPATATSPEVSTFGRDEFELSDSSDYEYSLTRERVKKDGASATREWSVGATISGSGGSGVVSVSAEVSGDYSNSEISNISTEIGDQTSLVATMGALDESFGETAYTVKPFAYWTDEAALVLDYAVTPTISDPGQPKTWWQQRYGVWPDLTLNLPRLLDYEEQSGISEDASRFISPGVSVLQGECSSDPTTLPMGSAPVDEPLCLVAQVENYSLRDAATSTRVNFYDADPDLGGRQIGFDEISPVAAREQQTAMVDWTPGVEFAGTTPRIFAEVEAGNTLREIHEENNKGFRGYFALRHPDAALHPPEDVFAEINDDNEIEVDWNVPSDLAKHEWLVHAYPDDGGEPTESTVDGDQTSTSIPNLAPGRYRVVIFAMDGTQTSAASHPSEPVATAGSALAPSVTLTEAPAEGSYTGSSVQFAFDVSPEEAETECFVDGQPRPCISPLRLSGLEAGSHTFQVAATLGEVTTKSSRVTWTVGSAAAPSVTLTEAPEEGSYSGPSVQFAFDVSPAEAETECFVDGQPRPCISPLRLNGLEGGSHAFQVRATLGEVTTKSPILTWTVDDTAPSADRMQLAKLTTQATQAVRYRGADAGGSGLAGYEIRVTRAGRRGGFESDPVLLDETTESLRRSDIPVARGQTACVAVRSYDSAGNKSSWTGWSCTTREMDEAELSKQGPWTRVRGKSLSEGRALQTNRSGAALSVTLGRATMVHVFATRCRRCGTLEIQMNGRRRRVIDLGETRRGPRVVSLGASWVSGHAGSLRLISRGGGTVRIDGIAAWRTGGWGQEESTSGRR